MSENVTVSVAPMRERIAEEVRALLARRKISASELARRIGATQPYISRRLTGDLPLDVDDLEKIAVVLGVEVSDLIPRTVVHTVSPGMQTTVPESELPVRLHPFSRPSHQIPAQSTRRTSRLSLAHA